MIFNSPEYLIFFLVVLIVNFLSPARFRWLILLIASFYFYFSWNPQFLFLLIGITVVNHILAIRMGRSEEASQRKVYLALSLFLNLAILLFFKYFNRGSIWYTNLLVQFGNGVSPQALELLFPLGLSFYTFKLISYSVDVYRGRQKPELNIGKFALFVSFFPTLIAGPIERAANFLPQIHKQYHNNQTRISTGLLLITWGFFKKLVIADRLAVIVDPVYDNPAGFSGLPLLIATYAYALQIYCDFSGYTDIAIGTARILGYDLTENFRQPYFAKSVSEFWRRWHVTLSNWFRDYVFYPLERKRQRTNIAMQFINIMVVFLLTGMWHGSTVNFIIWGGLHGVFIILTLLISNFWGKLRPGEAGQKPSPWKNGLLILLTFQLVSFAWIFFRADTISDALIIVSRIFTYNRLDMDYAMNMVGAFDMAIIAVSLGILLVVDFLRERGKSMDFLSGKPTAVRWAVYYALFFSILLFGKLNVTEFIYAGF